MRTVAGVSLAVIMAAILLGIMQYRGVMGPLGALRIGVPAKLPPVSSPNVLHRAAERNLSNSPTNSTAWRGNSTASITTSNNKSPARARN